LQALHDRIALPANISRQVINKLRKHGLLRCAGEEGNELLPGRSLDQIRLEDLIRAVRRDDDRVFRPVGGIEPEVGKLVELLETNRQSLLQNKTLADLIRESPGP